MGVGKIGIGNRSPFWTAKLVLADSSIFRSNLGTLKSGKHGFPWFPLQPDQLLGISGPPLMARVQLIYPSAYPAR